MAGSSVPISGYFRKVSAISPTRYGRGSTISAAPYLRAATIPAPIFIPPCVRVGPSSTTRTRLPRIFSQPSTKMGLAASTTAASGACRTMLSRTWFTWSSEAESTLLMTMTCEERKFVWPGCQASSCPARSGSTTVIWRSGL